MKNGFPTPAEENLLDAMTLDAYLVGNRTASFMMRVTGTAMREEGIREGDFVIVERSLEAKTGNIVIVETDSGWSMKVFDARKPVSITAVVTAVVRKYG